MIVPCSRNLSKFQCIFFEKSTTITYNHFKFFSGFVHPLAKTFYGEMHKDDGNLLKAFYVNAIYCLRDMD